MKETTTMTNEEARLLLKNSCVMAGHLLSLSGLSIIMLLNEEELAFVNLGRMLLGDESTGEQLLDLAKALELENIVELKVMPAIYGATQDGTKTSLDNATAGLSLAAIIQRISSMSSNLPRAVQPLVDVLPLSVLSHPAFKPKEL
jgi:hypothetical protein